MKSILTRLLAVMMALVLILPQVAFAQAEPIGLQARGIAVQAKAAAASAASSVATLASTTSVAFDPTVPVSQTRGSIANHVNSSGVMVQDFVNRARFDYDLTGTLAGLLVEPYTPKIAPYSLDMNTHHCVEHDKGDWGRRSVRWDQRCNADQYCRGGGAFRQQQCGSTDSRNSLHRIGCH
jgi:hypothetical protein